MPHEKRPRPSANSEPCPAVCKRISELVRREVVKLQARQAAQRTAEQVKALPAYLMLGVHIQAYIVASCK